MVPSSLRILVAAASLAIGSLPTTALAQPAGEAARQSSGHGAATEAFDLLIEAPQALRELLERHLELQRYRALTDLSDAEIQSLLQSAQQNAGDLLATMGYFSPEIRISLEAPAAALPGVKRVRIAVESGPQAQVGAVSLQLQGAITQEPRAQEQRQSVEDLWPLATGEPFSQDAWDLAKEQTLKRLLGWRFPAARLMDSRAVVDAAQNRVDLQLVLDSGPLYTLGRLDIAGNQRYSAELARRLANLPLESDYELTALVEAQQRLTDSGYYDTAYLNLDLSSEPGQAVVQAQLKEASMQKLVFGIGASTDSGSRVSAEHTYNQVPGIEWRAVNKLTLARDAQTFASDWTSQPGRSPWRWAASALTKQENVAQIDTLTERLRLGRFITDRTLDLSYYLQYERAEAVYREIGQRSNNEALSANYDFTWRRFDSNVFPTRGWGLGGELSAGTVLGPQQEPYTRALLHGRYYHPLGQSETNLFVRQHAGRLMVRAQLGGVVVDNATQVPFSQLFLTGGDTTVRGYKYQEIGVTHDGVLSADAGRYLASASVEWQRPLVRNGQLTDWETTVFVDTGAVANRTEQFSFKSGVGVGARWKSPIGPLQIDLAYGLATQALRLHLNVGFIF